MDGLAALKPLGQLERALGPGALFLVGGTLRDLCMGRPGSDWDLATPLMPGEVMERLKQAHFKVFPTGLQHGTVTVMVGDRPVEITTFRSDGPYLDGRRPESVHLGVALEEDLARRDFTINAMALPLERALEALDDWQDALVDPFGGRADLALKLIRAVGEPKARFEEDGLRPLRACRFAAQLDFEVEAATLAAIPECLEVCRKVSVERVYIELTKLLCGQAADRGLRYLEASRLLDVWMPELRATVGFEQNAYHDFCIWEHTLRAIQAGPKTPEMRWALLLHDAGKPESAAIYKDRLRFVGHEAKSVEVAAVILNRLRASHALRDQVLALIARHGDTLEASPSPRAARRLLHRLALSNVSLDDWLEFRKADLQAKRAAEQDLAEFFEMEAALRAAAQAGPCLKVQDLALNGHELMSLAHKKGGPWLKELQQHLLEAVLDDPSCNTAQALHALVQASLQLKESDADGSKFQS